MKNKSKNVVDFINGLHDYIVNNPLLRKNTHLKNESQIQSEIRPIIISYLTKYFQEKNNKNPEEKAIKSFYWEGEEGRKPFVKCPTFSSKNYADFIITCPYNIAVEYKKSKYGSTIKHGIGQSIIHTLCGEYDFVYLLFQDESKDKKILKSIDFDCEKHIIEKMWERNNLMIKVI